MDSLGSGARKLNVTELEFRKAPFSMRHQCMRGEAHRRLTLRPQRLNLSHRNFVLANPQLPHHEHLASSAPLCRRVGELTVAIPTPVRDEYINQRGNAPSF